MREKIKLIIPDKRKVESLFYSFIIISLITALNLGLVSVVGYRAIGILYLLFLQVAVLLYKDFHIVLAAIISALLWNYLFIPPKFTFGISSKEDWLLVVCFIVTSVITGYLNKINKQREQELNERKLLEESERIYKTLLNSVSHEVKTPLAAIRGFVQYFLQGDFKDKTKAADDVINEINIASLRLEEVVQNLLNMGRLESGNLKLHREPSDISDILNAARLRNKTDGRKFMFYFDNNLPLVDVDVYLMEQAFENIYINACLYTPDDTLIITVVKVFKDLLIITITDNGPGLGNEPENVFKKFYRITPNNTGGTGLGLSITKAIIELHGGTIMASNVSEGGARFVIQLPWKANQ